MSEEGAGAVRRGWRTLWEGRGWLLGAPIGAVLALLLGAGGLAGTNFALHATSESEFCLGCHTIERNVRPEWEASSHYRNAAGVRAECKDCHLPQDDWFALVATKVAASLDIVPELMGTYHEPEQWEAHRAEMAERVWAEYRADDSRYCRGCHDVEAMALDEQSGMGRTMHGRMEGMGKTCIDCHKGLVHALPRPAET